MRFWLLFCLVALCGVRAHLLCPVGGSVSATLSAEDGLFTAHPATFARPHTLSLDGDEHVGQFQLLLLHGPSTVVYNGTLPTVLPHMQQYAGASLVYVMQDVHNPQERCIGKLVLREESSSIVAFSSITCEDFLMITPTFDCTLDLDVISLLNSVPPAGNYDVLLLDGTTIVLNSSLPVEFGPVDMLLDELLVFTVFLNGSADSCNGELQISAGFSFTDSRCARWDTFLPPNSLVNCAQPKSDRPSLSYMPFQLTTQNAFTFLWALSPPAVSTFTALNGLQTFVENRIINFGSGLNGTRTINQIEQITCTTLTQDGPAYLLLVPVGTSGIGPFFSSNTTVIDDGEPPAGIALNACTPPLVSDSGYFVDLTAQFGYTTSLAEIIYRQERIEEWTQPINASVNASSVACTPGNITTLQLDINIDTACLDATTGVSNAVTDVFVSSFSGVIQAFNASAAFATEPSGQEKLQVQAKFTQPIDTFPVFVSTVSIRYPGVNSPLVSVSFGAVTGCSTEPPTTETPTATEEPSPPDTSEPPTTETPTGTEEPSPPDTSEPPSTETPTATEEPSPPETSEPPTGTTEPPPPSSKGGDEQLIVAVTVGVFVPICAVSCLILCIAILIGSPAVQGQTRRSRQA